MSGRIQQSIERLANKPEGKPRFSIKVAVGEQAPSVGRALAPDANTSSGGSAVLSGGYTEPDYSARQFHATIVRTSADGFTKVVRKPVAVIVMQDDENNTVPFSYAAPPA